MLSYYVLTSGSCGNAYIFSDGDDSIMVDMGLTFTGLQRRVDDASLSLDRVKAIFLTHLHPDHAKGIGVISRKLKLKISLSRSMFDGGMSIISKYGLKRDDLNLFDYGEVIKVGSFEVTSFKTSHDSQGSVGYYIKNGSKSFFLLTDTGIYTDEEIEYSKKSDIIFLESNYDRQMLLNGNYPYPLKMRVMGERGHLSNDQAREFIIKANLNDKKIYFIHLSENNNTPTLVENMSRSINLNNTYIVCQRGAMYGESI